MPKMQKLGNSIMIAIPAQICRIKGWQKGDEACLVIDGKTGQVVIEPVKA